ncbi:MAG: hypothetical protein VR73_15880 [Gammaproteobacteria bacterium BRH_c0]|nr:MAG: hypothetical protein VR73_15880 [Gammaproteobacteria bacterium BRH_c0]
MSAPGKPQLGAPTEYPASYDPGLLVSIPRAAGREQLGAGLVFRGADVWTAYELSWLNAKGRPCVAIAEFTIACDSPAIVESKSFKLYLNSLNQERFASTDAVRKVLQKDLGQGFGAAVDVQIFAIDEYADRGMVSFTGQCLDDLDVECDDFQPDADYLRVAEHEVTEQLYSHLLKTNCPVTGQPDWASISICYSGRAIEHRGLLQYLVSFRGHEDFHEHCVERIFSDIVSRCQPASLQVYARYTRRGGLDINPYRSTGQEATVFCRTARQ